jgi:adenylate kinase
MTKYPAILLLGPTGSGKTPLGDLVERRGLRGARCLHFDFGANLRRIVERDQPGGDFSRAEIDFLKRVLQSGALLEDEQFPIAKRVLQSFLTERGADASTVIVLNGLPRHAGQAAALEPILDVRTVIVLNCSPETVAARIRANTGGDRAGRADDDPASVARKLDLFNQRTAPLMEYYRARGAAILSIKVTPEMTAAAMWEAIESSHRDA